MGITVASPPAAVAAPPAAAASSEAAAEAEAVAHNQVGFCVRWERTGAARTKSDYPGIILGGIYSGFAARSSSHTHTHTCVRTHTEAVSGQHSNLFAAIEALSCLALTSPLSSCNIGTKRTEERMGKTWETQIKRMSCFRFLLLLKNFFLFCLF